MMLWKKIQNLGFVRGVNFEVIQSLENNGTQYLLIFENSCDEICNSKAVFGFGSAGSHRGLSAIHIKNNLFHQSKLGWDIALHNSHIGHFQAPRDVMPVSTLCLHLGLG